MRTMLLSFQPKWYEQIKAGKKIYEYRRQFVKDEEVAVYLYVSKPLQAIVGYIELGKRIDLLDWKERYKMYPEVSKRIDSYLEKNRFVMPIKLFKMTEPLHLSELNGKLEKFIIPQSYYYLDNFPELFKLIKEKCQFTDIEFENKFIENDIEQICVR